MSEGGLGFKITHWYTNTDLFLSGSDGTVVGILFPPIRPSYDPDSIYMSRCEQAACVTVCHMIAIGLYVVRCSENIFTADT